MSQKPLNIGLIGCGGRGTSAAGTGSGRSRERDSGPDHRPSSSILADPDPLDGRGPFLDEACGDDRDLRALDAGRLKELLGRMKEVGHPAEWKRLKRDLDSLEETEVTTKTGQHFLLRSDVQGDCGKALQAAGVAIPPRVRQPS